ncbi:MAG: ParA family protein [Desulfuromonadales bacterium]
MERVSPFVVTGASEKGGVGKTTIATTLAVYLKALREDLPVTIASFDNHFSVDNMFALGPRPERSVADLVAGVPACRLAALGEYGVQYIPSDRNLVPADGDVYRLRHDLSSSALPGILVFDTRPVLDLMTRNALLAADLVLVPVKDRPSLVNAASLRLTLEEGASEPARLWILPSLVDARLRVRGSVGVREFLAFSARERGLQVLETFISKSPKVEGLATSFSSRIHPVLTHARTTTVHQQFRELADFVLQCFDKTETPLNRQPVQPAAGREFHFEERRLPVSGCPACGNGLGSEKGHFFQDLHSRRRGFLHPSCLLEILHQTEIEDSGPSAGMLVLRTTGPGVAGPEAEMAIHVFDGEGKEVAMARGNPTHPPFDTLLPAASGRLWEELCRELLLISLEEDRPEAFLAGQGNRRFAAQRRKVLREILGKDR